MAVNKVVFGAVSIMDISDSTVTPETLAEGVTAYDKTGEKITGTKPDPVYQSKTVTPSTSEQVVTPDSDYDGLSEVTVEAMLAGSVSNPKISVSANGVIESWVSVSAGYVPMSAKTWNYYLSTVGAKTITPSTVDQTAVATQKFTTGDIVVAGDANLVPENIKSGVSIFGVEGSYGSEQEEWVFTLEDGSEVTKLVVVTE